MTDPFAHLITEAHNPATEHLDALSTLDLVRAINAEDCLVAPAVGQAAESIAAAIEAIAARLRRGGRLLYVGAGTSGRLGVLDAAECPPTFRVPQSLVVGIIAGGEEAMTSAVEGAEDDAGLGGHDLAAHGVNASDAVVGIAASGRTPYVLGAIDRARHVQALTVALVCNPDTPLAAGCDLAITVIVGPEVVTGSTRLKAGTATKLVLNLLSTGVMVRLGKVYRNRMVDVHATNVKLRARARRLVCDLTGVDAAAADRLLQTCAGEVKTAVVVQARGVSPEQAHRLLMQAGGSLRAVLE